LAVNSRQSSVGSQQSTVSSRQSAVVSQQSSVSSRQSAVVSQQSSVSSQQSSVSQSISLSVYQSLNRERLLNKRKAPQIRADEQMISE